MDACFAGLTNVAVLIGCDLGELKLALSTRKMRVGNDTIVQKLTLSQVKLGFVVRKITWFIVDLSTMLIPSSSTYWGSDFTFQASDARDALAKSIYSCLFDWLVEQINKSLAVGKRRTGRSISILDIYGFESFEVCPWFSIHPFALPLVFVVK